MSKTASQIDLPAITSQSNLIELKKSGIKMKEGRGELSVFNLRVSSEID